MTVRIFVSFDPDHDADLRDRLLAQAATAGSGFEISARSEAARAMTPEWDASTRRRIDEADEVIFICGEHTAASLLVATELRMAQEDEKPYFLLWGRREMMCTKPDGARPADNMYSWTPEILRTQIAMTLRVPLRSPAPDAVAGTNPFRGTRQVRGRGHRERFSGPR